jgi:xylulokinase
LAAVGAGAYKNVVEACEATIRVVKETPANKTAIAKYNKAFPIYQSLYPALKDRFSAIAELST